jgi:hypothetical protein
MHKKIVQILRPIQCFGPSLDVAVLGLGSIVSSLGSVAEDLAEGVNNVYEDYTAAKEAQKPYKFMDSVRSFGSTFAGSEVSKSLVTRPSAAMKALTADYGGLHPRLELKGGGGE